MKPNYAESTLLLLYNKLNARLSELDLDYSDLDDYIQSCVNFYQIIKAEEAWKILPNAVPKDHPLRNLPKELYDEFLRIAARDGDKCYRVLPESEFYSDGSESLYIVDELLTFAPNPDFTDEDRDRLLACMDADEEYDGPEMEIPSYDDFYTLHDQQEGKPIYVPKNILVYSDDDYYEKTPQVTAMESFLRNEAKVPKNEVSTLIIMFLADICDASCPVGYLTELSLENLEELGGKIKSDKQIQRFVDLLMDLNNNTRMPSNRGFTPNEVRSKVKTGTLQSFEFGPGVQKALRDGDLELEAMRRAIADMDIPEETKKAMLQGIDKAALPN